MSKQKCMVSANSKEEFDRIRNAAPFSVTMVRSDNCTHCRDLHPIIETACDQLQGAIPVIDCPVDNPWCVEQVRRYKKNGIPLVIGTERGKEHAPTFMIEGSRKDEVKKYFGELAKIVKSTWATRNPGIQPQQHGDPGRGDGISTGKDVDGMVDLLVGAPARRNNVALCTPGYDCDRREFEDKAIAFLLARKGKRNDF